MSSLESRRVRPLSFRLVFVASALLAASACRRESSSDEQAPQGAVHYGEPVGIQVKGPGIPALLAAVAVSEKASPDAFVNPLASQLYAAVVSCPLAKEQLLAEKPIVLRMSTHGDLLATGSAETEISAKCVADALVGKPLPGAQNLRLVIELRLNPSTP